MFVYSKNRARSKMTVLSGCRKSCSTANGGGKKKNACANKAQAIIFLKIKGHIEYPLILFAFSKPALRVAHF